MADGRLPHSFIGAAGEHYVLFRLHLQNLLAAQAPRNAPSVDVLVLNSDETLRAAIQVKSSSRPMRDGWTLGKKDETNSRSGLYYSLINLHEPLRPVAFVLPSAVVAEAVAKQHLAWHAEPRKRGTGPKVDSTIRNLRDPFRFNVEGYPPGWMEPYREAWELLKGKVG